VFFALLYAEINVEKEKIVVRGKKCKTKEKYITDKMVKDSFIEKRLIWSQNSDNHN
jgi:hypothetical protein